MALTDMIPEKNLNTIRRKCFDHLPPPDAFLDAPAKYIGTQRWHQTALKKWAVQPKHSSKAECVRELTSSWIHYHQRENYHERGPVIVQWHEANLTAATKQK